MELEGQSETLALAGGRGWKRDAMVSFPPHHGKNRVSLCQERFPEEIGPGKRALQAAGENRPFRWSPA